MTGDELDTYCDSLASTGGVYSIAAAWIHEIETEAAHRRAAAPIPPPLQQRGARRRDERTTR